MRLYSRKDVDRRALKGARIAILGYGMAASLEEMTYRSGDPALNADVARYGTDHSVEKFKRDLGQLMDLIEQAGTTADSANGADKKSSDTAAQNPSASSAPSAVKKSVLIRG